MACSGSQATKLTKTDMSQVLAKTCAAAEGAALDPKGSGLGGSDATHLAFQDDEKRRPLEGGADQGLSCSCVLEAGPPG